MVSKNLNFKSESSTCYDKLEDNCDSYDRLYAMDVLNKIYPKDWIVPTEHQWNQIFKILLQNHSIKSKFNEIGKYLKKSRGSIPIESNSGNNLTKFNASDASALRGDSFSFIHIHYSSMWWSALSRNEKLPSTSYPTGESASLRFSNVYHPLSKYSV